MIQEIKGYDYEVALGYMAGSEDLLFDILGEFYKSIDSIIDEIGTALSDIENPDSLQAYKIKAHSTKSTTRMLGNEGIASLSEKCEMAAKADDINEIKALTPSLIDLLKNTKSDLSVLFA